MMERLPNLIIFLNLLLIASTSDNAHVKSMFPFGDSLFDPGNNHFTKNCTIQADFPPYGSTFFNRPTGRFTNGRTVADFISQYLGMELQLPYQELRQQIVNGSRKEFPANGISFASAGSGVLLNTNKESGVSSIHVQLQQFQSLIEKNHISKDQIKNSLFLLESGSNDIFDFHVSLFPRLFPSAHVDKLVKEYVSVIDKLCKLGARRIAIFGVGPMGCIPATVLLPHLPIGPNDACNDKINSMVTHYNDELEKLVNGIPKKYPGVNSVYGAVYDVTQSICANPKNHGFANVKEACCGAGPKNGRVQCGLEGTKMCSKPSDFLFWDYFHPTEHTYEVLAKAFWEGDTNKMRPMNLKALANIA